MAWGGAWRLVTGACITGSLPVCVALVGQRVRFQATVAMAAVGLVIGVVQCRNQINRSCVIAIHKATANAFSKPRTRNCSKPCRLRAWALTHSLVAARSL